MKDVVPLQRRPRRWPRAGLLLGGAFAWTTAVFGGLAEHQLLTGGSAAFALVLTIGVVTALSVRAAYAEPAEGARETLRRWMATIPTGLVVWLFYVFVTSVICGRNAEGAMLALGSMGILTVFFAGVAAQKARAMLGADQGRDPAFRAVRALAWTTILLVTCTALISPLAQAMIQRGRHSAGASVPAVE